MPGIAGIIGGASPDECQRLVRTMLGSMKHRDPCASGNCFAPSIGAYGGWIAHEGSFPALQSAGCDVDEIALLVSGEYASTFEDVATAYREKGDSFVKDLNGLFSGLLIDRKRGRALLFNDRFGSERIYIHERGGTTFFASEAKALLSVVPELRALDDQGVAQFLTYGSTLGGRTLFRGIRLLPGGSLLVFDGGAPASSRYFLPQEWESQSGLPEEAFESRFEEAFRAALPRYLSSGEKIGISLTAGLDTRMIMACLPKQDVEPVCYTYAGLTGETLDVRLGARVARACGLEHHTLRIEGDFLSRYADHVDRTVFVTDGCAGALGAHEIYLTAKARQLARVRLTGNFGSEVLRSMSTFKPLGLAPGLFDPGFASGMAGAWPESASAGSIHPVTHAAFEEIPWHLFGTLAAARSQLTFRTPYLDNELVRLAYQAPAESRNSPRSALRLIHDNSPALGAIPTDRGLLWGSRGPGMLARRLFCGVTFKLDYLHKEGLPHWLSPFESLIGSLSRAGLLGLHKFLPYRLWFRRELAGQVGDAIASARSQNLPYWNSRFLASVASEHAGGQKNYIREINAILTIEAAERLLVRGWANPR